MVAEHLDERRSGEHGGDGGNQESAVTPPHVPTRRGDQSLSAGDDRRCRRGQTFGHRRSVTGQRKQPREQRTSADATSGGIVRAHLQQLRHSLMCAGEQGKLRKGGGEGTQHHENVVMMP